MKNAKDYLTDILEKCGQEMGVSDWRSFDQNEVWAHGKLTGDDGPIHNDPEWSAAHTPFGGTIVQGSLLLSTLTQMAKKLQWPEGDMLFRMNYGFNRIRIINPVATGQKYRGRFSLQSAAMKGDHALVVTLGTVLEVEGQTDPALVAEWLIYLQFNS